MPVWEIEFHPPQDQHHSPFDYIINLSSSSDKAAIEHRLTNLAERELADWPHTWVHKIVDDIFQLTVNNHRLLYCLDGKKIVILHACRKVKQKTKQKDINRAITNYNNYFEKKKGR